MIDHFRKEQKSGGYSYCSSPSSVPPTPGEGYRAKQISQSFTRVNTARIDRVNGTYYITAQCIDVPKLM